MAIYQINPSRKTLHGTLSKKIPPCLTINSGDSVTFSTLEGDWRVSRPKEAGTGKGIFFPRKPEYDMGHALCGPIAIRGAHPQMTLAVHIDELVPGSWGWSRTGISEESHLRQIDWYGKEHFMLWDIDREAGICRSGTYQVPLHPFLGVLTVCPDSPHPVRTHLPGNHGANLDCKELVEGSTIYLPIFVDDALFSTGDGHALQGNGESGGTAIECPMERATLTFRLLDYPLESPVCNTPSGWITFGFGEDLNTACYEALRRMIALMTGHLHIPEKDAWNLSSLVVDLSITQIVNGVRGVHALLPHNAFLSLH